MTTQKIGPILLIPEIAALDSPSSFVRIPPELDVPLTPRVRRLVDSRTFRRLAQTSQLGFVRLVYPGATHTRFEHSLGVYRLSLLMLKRLARDARFSALVRPEEAEILILAALLHDIGHFPYCHLLEDLKPVGLDSHEAAAETFLRGELAAPIRDDWNVDPENVADVLLHRKPHRRPSDSDAEYRRRVDVFRLLASVLSGPVDVDKMDYLTRDSVAAGVPYGRNFDVARLVGSVCLNERGDGIAISSKGKTAAELMVFARYVMFSEVYWHHAARSATVMFQRAVAYLAQDADFPQLIARFRRLSDFELQSTLFALCRPTSPDAETLNLPNPPVFDAETDADADETQLETPKTAARRLLLGIFGPRRRLYKRICQFGAAEEPELYPRLAGRPYPELCEISDRFAASLGVSSSRLLLDAPPVDKEVEFKIDVFYPQENVYRPLSTVSPVVRALAQEQFDDYVKRARVFAAPSEAAKLRQIPQITSLLAKAVDDFEQNCR